MYTALYNPGVLWEQEEAKIDKKTSFWKEFGHEDIPYT
jgi:hypothetical protein